MSRYSCSSHARLQAAILSCASFDAHTCTACPPRMLAALLPALLRVQQLDKVDVEGATPLYHSMWRRLQVRRRAMRLFPGPCNFLKLLQKRRELMGVMQRNTLVLVHPKVPRQKQRLALCAGPASCTGPAGTL